MKSYSQCLLCFYVLGRSCKKKNQIIEEDIYNNKIKCSSFKSLEEEELYVEDSCCNENSTYYRK